MHRIQEQILNQLIFHPTCKFSELKSKDIESNHFMYHLGKLTTEGLVIKRSGHYSLTPKGKNYVDNLSLTNLSPRIQPKIVTLIACKNKQNEWLLYRRSRQPFIDLVGFPYGKIHIGETILEAAHRELKEKTGITATLTHIGEAYIAVRDTEEQMLSHMLCHIFVGTDPKGKPHLKSQIGECFWGSIENQIPANLIPGVREVYKLITHKLKNESRFFAELNLKYSL